jgi:murein DD-endopeptidase MepM/ murein hydrolase activator NlpD
MNKLITPFSLCFILVAPGYGESLLKAASFPETFEDVSFTERMQFKADDYELYQPEYDDDGFCVKNCAYPGLNIKYEVEKSEIDTQNAIIQSAQYEQNQQGTVTQNTLVGHVQPIASLPANTQTIVSVVENASSNGSNQNVCLQRNSQIPSGQSVPWGEPLVSYSRISSPYGPRVLQGKKSFHDGIDFATPVGTPVYATADGTVTRIINDDRCGRGIRIKHGDGTNTIFCHLNRQMVSSGENVHAGCKIAESGNTGHSTGPHLHYGMRDASGNKIDPTPYINRTK